MGSRATMAAAAKPRATTSIHHVRIVDETGCCRGRYTCSSAGYNLRDLNICKALPKLPLQFSLPCVVAGFCVLLVNCTISPCSKQCEGLKVNDGRERSTNKTGFGGYLLSNLECKVVSFFLAIFNTHMTQHPEQTWFTFQMSRDAFPSRELSLSGSSRCSSQPPSTRRVGSGKRLQPLELSCAQAAAHKLWAAGQAVAIDSASATHTRAREW